ncbi:Epithelial growth factor receptor [Oopsacas minuta]|uniref:Epithelial growth factor receptor n=1 Tax=Oopsacas minuta TaxID=111878 RepID=A0AAV7JV41_9METZ|nr:Epithelial growth factor receptor [Oopsacas minuta]
MKTIWYTFVYLLIAFTPLAVSQTICYGQDFILEHENTTLLLSQLQTYFSNCEYVYDNLEIVFTEMIIIPAEFSMIFSSIREIRGYLLLENIEADSLTFTELVIIRGMNSFAVNNTSNALVLKNTKINSIIFPNFREISQHDVTVYNSQSNISTACNLNGVNWADILNQSPSQKINFNITNCTTPNCVACTSGFCWNENNCQLLTKEPCSSCSDRCLPTDNTSCCDQECSAGCEGAISTCVACSSCQDLTLPITCISSCADPSAKIITTFLSPPRLDGQGTCISPLILENPNLDFCKKECNEVNTMCVEGVGSNMLSCRVCGLNEDVCGQPYTLANNEIGPALLVPIIPKLSCGIIPIFVSIRLNMDSFNHINPVTPVYLEVFNGLLEISDYLVIEDYPSFYGEAFTFLSQLTRIRGDTLYMGLYAVYIRGNAFREIDLRNLQFIDQGSILIENNTELCYLPTSSGFESLRSGISVSILGQDLNCPCHINCEQSEGCWGPSNTQCIICAQVQISSTCQENCESLPNTFADLTNRQCVPCDVECNNCTGIATNCTQCINVRYEGECIPECPTTTYETNGECLPCNDNCKTNNITGPICSGPTNMFGLAFNGCNECSLYTFESTNNSTISNYTCISICIGGYQEFDTSPSPVCRDCNSACTRCTGRRVEDCDIDSCTFFLQENDQQCTLTCSNSTQYSPANNTCRNCDDNCIGCNGETSMDCNECRFLSRGSECVSSCRNNEYITSSNECELCNQELCSTCSVSRDNCTSCSKAAFSQNDTLICLEMCPAGYYRAGNISCLTCNRECINCTEALDTDCQGCRNFHVLPEDRCASECPLGAMVMNATKTCLVIDTFLQPAVIAGLSVGAIVFLAIVCSVITAIIIATVCSRRYKKKLVTKERMEEGTLLPMREKGQIQRTIQGLPEFTLLGYNYETLDDVTPKDFPLTIIDRSYLEPRERIGKGFHSYVYANFYTHKVGEAFPVAVKTFYEVSLKDNYQAGFDHVIRDMSKMSHPSFVQIFGYNTAKPDPYIVTQLLIGPSLHTLFSQYPGTISEEKIFNFIAQINDGMLYLESHKLVYGNLTARNVLLVNHDEIKLTDYFIHRFSEPRPENVVELPIPDRWMSPELALSRVPTHKSDIWAFGVVFWEMLSFAELPYNRVADDDVVTILQQGQRLAQPKSCTVDLYGYLLQCFIFEPIGRPTFEKLHNELKEMAKNPNKYIFIQEDTIERININTLEPSRISKDSATPGSKDRTLVIGNTNVCTLTHEDIQPDELGLGEYIDEEEVNKNIDEDVTQNSQDTHLLNAEYSEISEVEINQTVVNEYDEIDVTKLTKETADIASIPESQLPLFISCAPISTPLSSLGLPEMISPKHEDIVNPYETVGGQNNSIFSPYSDPDNLGINSHDQLLDNSN